MMTCNECGQGYTGARCACGYTPPRAQNEPRNDLRSVVSRKTGIRYYLCSWSHGCNMPCTTMPEIAESILCRWHEVCRYAPDQASSEETFAAWFNRMKEDYPSHGWWGAPIELVWPVLQGTNLMPEEGKIMLTHGTSSGHMTREEFGLDLYEAIKTAAAHQQARNNVQMYLRHGKAKKAELEEQKVGVLFKDLHRVMSKGTIAPADSKAIMRRYEV